jgi:hypothetical protein
VGEVGLPALVGHVGLEAHVGRARSLLRLGVTSPSRTRIRLIVAVATSSFWNCERCHAIVFGPASKPRSPRSCRISTMPSMTSCGVADGESLGRRDLGSNAASPSAR